jgi:hypothetical protein
MIQDLTWTFIIFEDIKHTKKLSNWAPIQLLMGEGLSFLSLEPLDVGATHPLYSFHSSHKLTSGANELGQ